jgi:hypothetical protein
MSSKHIGGSSETGGNVSGGLLLQKVLPYSASHRDAVV